MAHGGEVFVLDMGKPVRIIDLSTKMIELSGLRPGDDIRIEIVGIRPGEKLHEDMITEDDARMTVELDDRYVICPSPVLAGWSPKRLNEHGAKPVAESFRYSSDTNDDWLDRERLLQMIEKSKH